MIDNEVYLANGYESRKDYLESLAEYYGFTYRDVLCLANILGQEEDFDGLISALEDLEDWE